MEVSGFSDNNSEQMPDIQARRLGCWKMSEKESETALQRANIAVTGTATDRMSANT